VLARRAPADQIGDPLYNLVVVVDDAAMAISHVIRGEDHIANTAKQLLLYAALGAPAPLFAHTPLILNQEGRKLSKRDGVTSVNDFRAMGYTAAALANYMTLLGWSPPEGMGERFQLAEAATVFGFERVNRAGARFDWDKLNWLNSQVLHHLGAEALRDLLLPFWRAQGWAHSASDGATGTGRDGTADPAWQAELAVLLGPSLVTLQDGVAQARPFFERPAADAGAQQQLGAEGARAALAAVLDLLPPPSQPLEPQELLGPAAAAAQVKKGVLMKSLRAGLLGSLTGPDLVSSWVLLHAIGEDRPRLEAATAA
jgi:glutamyl-tRNA synthetase